MMKPCQTLYREAPKKGREKETRGKDQRPGKQQPKWGGPPGGKGTTKNWTLLQSPEAYQPKKGKINDATL
jgi:hypothetical protein